MTFDPTFIERARDFLSYAYRSSPVQALTSIKLLMDRFRLSGAEAAMLAQQIWKRND